MDVARAFVGLAIASFAAACTPDIAVGTGGATSTGIEATDATSTTSTSGATGPATTNAASTSSGGTTFPPCGNVTDTFDVEDGHWLGNPDYVDGVLRLVVSNVSHFATYDSFVYAPNECFLSAEFAASVFLGGGTTIAVGLTDLDDNEWAYAGFDGTGSALGITSDGASTNTIAPAVTHKLAVVFHDGFIHFLFDAGAGWQPIGITNRKAWMDVDTILEIGVAGPNGTTIDFEAFNVATVSEADLL